MSETQTVEVGNTVQVHYETGDGAEHTLIGEVTSNYPESRPEVNTNSKLVGNVTVYLDKEKVIEHGGRTVGKNPEISVQ